MKAALTIILSFLSTGSAWGRPQFPGPTSVPADLPSVHGMLLFGEERVFLSHLPMFHSPHDYQVILEAELDRAAQSAYRRSRIASQETVYTLVPETFVLPELVRSPRPFRAQLYRGHFERGGELIAGDVRVTLKEVLHFRRFDPKATRSREASYLLFGEGRDQYLAHLIEAKPDFDQVLRVRSAAPVERGGAKTLELKLKGAPATRPLAAAALADFESALDAKRLRLRVESSLYLEHGDLAH